MSKTGQVPPRIVPAARQMSGGGSGFTIAQKAMFRKYFENPTLLETAPEHEAKHVREALRRLGFAICEAGAGNHVLYTAMIIYKETPAADEERPTAEGERPATIRAAETFNAQYLAPVRSGVPTPRRAPTIADGMRPFIYMCNLDAQEPRRDPSIVVEISYFHDASLGRDIAQKYSPGFEEKDWILERKKLTAMAQQALDDYNKAKDAYEEAPTRADLRDTVGKFFSNLAAIYKMAIIQYDYARDKAQEANPEVLRLKETTEKIKELWKVARDYCLPIFTDAEKEEYKKIVNDPTRKTEML